MTHHARPHLTTHTRSKGHSAIAGIAYRLGARLQDRRTGEWHDYRRREVGEEIVGTLALAPVGAPNWVMDPQLAWDAVEAAERRKDSQIAHDFRVPIPFGLSDVDACAMARRIAQRICDDLHTFVFVGVHRDSGVDAMGIAKPRDRVGFHAHIYFPTRRFVFKADEAEANGADDDAAGKGDLVRATGAAASPSVGSAPTPTGATARLAAKRAAAEQENSRAWLTPAEPITVRRMAPSPSDATAKPSGFTARFLNELADKPELAQPTLDQRGRLIAWLQRVEQALRRLALIALRLADLRERRQRDDGARATFLVELDDRRRGRAAARQALAEWLDAHPWQLRLSRMVGGTERKPSELVALEGAVASFHSEVQQFKRGAADATGRVADFDARMAVADADHAQAQALLERGGQAIHGMDPLYGMVLVSIAAPHDVPALTAAMPEPGPGVSADDAAVVVLRTPEQAPRLPAHRPRLL